jgi:hypothetical protein
MPTATCTPSDWKEGRNEPGSGAKLGPYEILAPLDAGGMNEVYWTRDTKLKRDVALKVLRVACTASQTEPIGVMLFSVLLRTSPPQWVCYLSTYHSWIDINTLSEADDVNRAQGAQSNQCASGKPARHCSWRSEVHSSGTSRVHTDNSDYRGGLA